jgi:hypothetical protein
MATFPPDLEEPRLEHGKLRFEARDEDLQRAWTAIKQRVASTLLAPRASREQRAEDARRSDVRRRIEQAQKLPDSLD